MVTQNLKSVLQGGVSTFWTRVEGKWSHSRTQKPRHGAPPVGRTLLDQLIITALSTDTPTGQSDLGGSSADAVLSHVSGLCHHDN